MAALVQEHLDSVEQKVRAIIGRKLRLPEKKWWIIGNDESLRDLGMDAIDSLAVLIDAEEEFGIKSEITNVADAQAMTVDGIIRLVESAVLLEDRS